MRLGRLEPACGARPAGHYLHNINAVDTLVLDAPTLAKIFNGTITRWDDPAITALNSSASLPAEPIHVVFRSDGSGTTDNFQRYLDAAAGGAWGEGTGKTFNGGVGQGSPGNEGTSATVKTTEGAHLACRDLRRIANTNTSVGAPIRHRDVWGCVGVLQARRPFRGGGPHRCVVAALCPTVLMLSAERSAGVRQLFRLVQLEQIAERVAQEGLVPSAGNERDPVHLDTLLL